MVEARNIGIQVKPPTRECDDKDCPFHGKLPIRGIILTGVVYKKRMPKTVVIEREYPIFIKKYKRYERRRSRIPAHLPPCIDAEVGDKVKFAECRPLSKTVSFVVIENMGR
ncbi:MAG: 30S ribosomal protein S17 [Aigarchaeota archaeon]|nr:30S ribosomal protein S17 [Candidatus Pelearchaeum maunauluense]